MKIGIDIRTLLEKQYGGVSEYTLHLVRNILKNDSKNEYILFYNSFKDCSDRIPKFNENYKIVRTKYPNKIFNLILQKIFKYPKLDKLLNVDVFLGPNIGFYALSKNCKKILTVHDLSFLRYKEFFSWKRRLWHRVINAKKQTNYFDKIAAVSENTKNDLIDKCGVDKEKISVIYSGVDERYRQSLDFDKQEIQKKYNLPEKYILYLGTIEPRKNIRSLIKAYNNLRNNYKNLDNYKLVIAGGKGWKHKKIYREARTSKYKNDIIFTGYIDDKDKPCLYKLATIFVYPSFYEGFGFPPLEAMSVGTPVLSSFSSSLPEIVDNAAIMIDPYNIDEITKAMYDVIADNDLAKRMIEKGKMQSQKFGWKRTAHEYINLINE